MSGPVVVDSLPQAVHSAQDALDVVREHLRRLGERHAADPDVLHMAGTLAPRLTTAADGLANAGGRPATDERGTGDGLAAALRETASGLVSHRPSSGALLVADLRAFLADCADATVAVTVATQGATAAKASGLEDALGVVEHWVGRTHRWALTRLKTSAAQVLNGP